MAARPLVVDTNVLVYASDPTARHHRRCRALVEASAAGTFEVVLLPQVLLEFYATITSPRAPRPAKPGAITEVIEGLTRLWPVLPVGIDALEQTLALAREHPVAGQAIWDLFLVGQMLSHNIRVICTYNGRDFARLPVTAVTPDELLA